MSDFIFAEYQMTKDIPYQLTLALQDRIDFENVGERFVKGVDKLNWRVIDKFPAKFASSSDFSLEFKERLLVAIMDNAIQH